MWPAQARGTACQVPARAMRPCIHTPLACAPGPMSSDCSFAEHRLQRPLCLASQVWPEQGHEHRSQLSLASRSSHSSSGTSLRWVPRRCTSTTSSVAAAQGAAQTHGDVHLSREQAAPWWGEGRHDRPWPHHGAFGRLSKLFDVLSSSGTLAPMPAPPFSHAPASCFEPSPHSQPTSA